MPSFLHNIAGKAQTALNATPIGAHVQQFTNSLSSAQESQPAGKQDAPPPSSRSYALENVQHQFRVLQQQYSSNITPLQRNITAQKGVAIDFEGLARDVKAQSKELYLWGQSEDEDIKDVTDRLAYLNFVHGTLSSNLSKKLNSSRAHLKSVRDEESRLTPRRNIRDGILLQINRIKNDGQKGMAVDQKIAELENQLRKAKAEDDNAEKQFDVLKRKALRESEEEKWVAIREYAEKLLLLAEASNSFLSALPSVPPSPEAPYNGAKTTAAARSSVQESLNKWVIGHIKIPDNNFAGSTETDTRSFGVTHATELSVIGSSNEAPLSTVHDASISSPLTTPNPGSHPTDVSRIDLAPAQTRIVEPSAPSTASFETPATSVPISSAILEPRAPSVNSPGPGSSEGTLSQQYQAPQSPPYTSAEDEKRRLAREERERILGAGSSSAAPVYESAEDEKKRLERAERERILQLGGSGGGSSNAGNPSNPQDDSGPPPYQS